VNVKLIAVTKPMVDGINTADELISYCARVSNPANQLNVETAPRLLRYCVKHGHWSIFETASMTVEIVTSRAIAAQLLRHRSFTFQEFSQRYAQSANYEDFELRLQDKTNRQASGEVYKDDINEGMAAGIVQEAFLAYHLLLQYGVSRETARMILPLCTQTTLYMTGNVRSWIHYLEQRCAEGTQKEHRDVAQAVKEVFTTQFPTVAEAVWTTKQE
jgi:thymidylate synthase (FAD)